MGTQTDRITKPTTSSDTIALIVNTVMPAIHGIQDDMKSMEEIRMEVAVINNRLESIEKDTGDIYRTLDKFRATLYGNGNVDQAGLVTVVAQVKSWVGTRSKIELSVIIGVILAILGEVVGFIFVAIRLATLHP